MSAAAARCSKCGRAEGGDWSQCAGVCPLPISPHYQAPKPANDVKLFPQILEPWSTLASLQVLMACFDLDIRVRFFGGLYHASVASPHRDRGEGEGPMLSDALNNAVQDFREKFATWFVTEGPLLR